MAPFSHAARAERRPGQRRTPVHDRLEVDLGARAAEQSDLDDAAIHRKAFEVAREVLAADDVEDDSTPRAAGDSFTAATKSVVL